MHLEEKYTNFKAEIDPSTCYFPVPNSSSSSRRNATHEEGRNNRNSFKIYVTAATMKVAVLVATILQALLAIQVITQKESAEIV